MIDSTLFEWRTAGWHVGIGSGRGGTKAGSSECEAPRRRFAARRPDTVEAGISRKVAQRAVDRADDALQAQLDGRRTAPQCVQCQEPLARGAVYCDGCGARVPEKTDLEFHRTQIEPRLTKGRKWLGAMAILYAIGGIVYGVMLEDVAVGAVNLVLAGVQTGLWQWSTKSLLPAAVTSLVMFVTIHLLEAVVDPASLVRGLLIKVLFITGLVQTIRAALETRSLLGRGAAT